MTSFRLRVMRTLFGMADPLAPRIVGQLAFELFCRTANPRRMTPAERRVLGGAEALMAQARRHTLHASGRPVAAYEFRPASGRWSHTVLAIHGWRSRSEHMRALVEGFMDAGARVIAVDLPGHGSSGGRRLNMANAVAAIATTEMWFGPFDAIVGHSFGGAVAVNAAVGSVRGIDPVRTNRLVLLAAPSSMPMIFEDFGRFLNLGPRTQTAIADRVHAVAGNPLESFVGQIQLSATPIETLVLHAADDKEVAPAHAEGYARAGEHVQLAWVNGLGHRRILNDPAVVVHAVDFALRDRLAAPVRARTRRRVK